MRNGKSYSKKRYTKVARAFYRSNKHLREKVILATGKKVTGLRMEKELVITQEVER